MSNNNDRDKNITREIVIKINGIEKKFSISPDEKLITLLRRSGYKGVKYGCGEGRCGACTVIMDGKAVYSCILYAFQAHGRNVLTIEGVGSWENPHILQKVLVDEGAVQCGFCIPGMIMSAKAIFDSNPDFIIEDIIKQMDGNLCRCTGYEKIVSALKKVSEYIHMDKKGTCK